jgi:hypothetical protein
MVAKNNLIVALPYNTRVEVLDGVADWLYIRVGTVEGWSIASEF